MMSADRSAIMLGPDGAWSRENSPEFFTALGDPAPDYDASRFAITNFGFVRLAFIESWAEVTLHPRNVEAGAMSAMLKMLAASGAGIVRIRYLNQGRAERSDITLPLRGALMMLSALVVALQMETGRMGGDRRSGTERRSAEGRRITVRRRVDQESQYDSIECRYGDRRQNNKDRRLGRDRRTGG
jgi:hypothetical protein